MPGNYWSRFAERRLGRRRMLAAGGSAALSAAFLAACGGDDDSTPAGNTAATTGGTTGGTTGATGSSGSTGGATATSTGTQFTPPVDTTGQAKAGGTVKDWADGDAVHADALASNAHGVINFISAFAYPRMLRFKTPVFPELADGSLEGEVAESFELSEDKLTLTFKIRDGIKWDPRDPTNGRVLDVDDILFSWKKFSELNQSAGDMSADRTPNAPIESVSAPDSRTIVMKLKQPDSSLLPLFSSWDHFYIMPRESDGQFDPRTVVRGAGPWMLEEWTPSVRYVWAKNPDYVIKDRPWPDKWERPILPEYSSRLNQFRTGAIYTPVALAQDMIPMNKDLPETRIMQEAAYSTTIFYALSFGYNDDSPFKDQRVRQAVSMLVDPDGYINVIDNRKLFQDAGLDVSSAQNSVIAAGWGDFWLDPADAAEFGENAKYLGYNLDEAKKLLSAAGFPGGFDYDMYFSNSLYGDVYLQSVELIGGMLNDGGLHANMQGKPYEQYKNTYYEAYYGPSYESGKTNGFNGIIHLADPTLPTVTSHLYTFVHKDGGRFAGLSPDGNNPQLGDPKLNDEIAGLKLVFDHAEQVSKVHDIARYFTGQSYYIPRKAQIPIVSLTWPVLANFNVYQPSPAENQWAETNLQWWIDDTKAPLA